MAKKYLKEIEYYINNCGVSQSTLFFRRKELIKNSKKEPCFEIINLHKRNNENFDDLNDLQLQKDDSLENPIRELEINVNKKYKD